MDRPGGPPGHRGGLKISDCYDRTGAPLELLEWARLREDREYAIIRQDTLLNGFFLSTVWLGLNHNLSFQGPPLIFETILFIPGELGDPIRYATEAEARAWHSYFYIEIVLRQRYKNLLGSKT